MVSQKVAISPFLSFPRKRESSKFKEIWTPAGVYPVLDTGRSDSFQTFYEIIKINYPRKIGQATLQILRMFMNSYILITEK